MRITRRKMIGNTLAHYTVVSGLDKVDAAATLCRRA
jgi:hypothetical protein